MASVHEGHRKRLKARYTEFGFKGLNEHELLELLLTYAIPRKDVNELAHSLIVRFGSLEDVLNADISQLTAVNGVSEHTAILLHIVCDVRRKAEITKKENKKLDSVGTTMDYCYMLISGKRTESTMALLIDANSRVIRVADMSMGSPDSAPLSVRAVVIAAVESRAAGVVLAHNHPSGNSNPSFNDVAVTEQLVSALNTVGVTLLEHIIVGAESCTAIIHKQTKSMNVISNIVDFKGA